MALSSYASLFLTPSGPQGRSLFNYISQPTGVPSQVTREPN